MLRITLTASFLALLLLAGTARAESKILQGVYGQADVQRACQSANGRPTGGSASGFYGCVKDNCDGKGGQCSITCVEPTKCLGTTPEKLTGPTTPIGVLQNGKPTIRLPRPIPRPAVKY